MNFFRRFKSSSMPAALLTLSVAAGSDNFFSDRHTTLNRRPPMLRYACRGECDPSNKTRLESLIHICKRGSVSELYALLQKDRKLVKRSRSSDKVTALHVAAQFGHLNLVKVLVEEYNADVNASMKNQVSPLHLASLQGHAQLVDYLLDRGAEADAVMMGQTTALRLAIQSNHLQVARALIEQGKADVNLCDEDGASPLYMAVQQRQIEMTKLLLRSGANVNQETKSGASPLHLLASANQNKKSSEMRKREISLFNLLLSQGANINQYDKNGASALYLAAQNGDIDIVTTLLEYQDIDIDQPAKTGATPLFVAIFNNHQDIVSSLIKARRNGKVTAIYTGLTPLVIDFHNPPPTNWDNEDKLSAEMNLRMKALVEKEPIMLFMKGNPKRPRCKWSQKCVDILSEAGIRDYGHFDVLHDPEVRAAIKLYSDHPTFPQLYIRGKLINHHKQNGLKHLAEMQQDGSLAKLYSQATCVEKL